MCSQKQTSNSLDNPLEFASTSYPFSVNSDRETDGLNFAGQHMLHLGADS